MTDRTQRFQTVNDEPSRTKQSFAEEADINNIVQKHDARTLIQSLNLAEKSYGDVTSFQDFHEIMNVLVEAEQDFQNLPSDVRRLFDNDVAVYLDTAHDDDKRNALVDLGHLPESERRPQAAPAAPAPAAAEPPPEPAGGATAPPAAT